MESSGTAGDRGMEVQREQQKSRRIGVQGLFIQWNEAGALSTAQISSSVYAKCHTMGSMVVSREVQKPIFLSVCCFQQMLNLFYSPVRLLLGSSYQIQSTDYCLCFFFFVALQILLPIHLSYRYVFLLLFLLDLITHQDQFFSLIWFKKIQLKG